jgi:hypothetical protein
VVRIAITQAAYEATSATLPLGSVAVEPYFNAKGEGEICWMRSGSTGSGRCGGRARATARTSGRAASKTEEGNDCDRRGHEAI